MFTPIRPPTRSRQSGKHLSRGTGTRSCLGIRYGRSKPKALGPSLSEGGQHLERSHGEAITNSFLCFLFPTGPHQTHQPGAARAAHARSAAATMAETLCGCAVSSWTHEIPVSIYHCHELSPLLLTLTRPWWGVLRCHNDAGGSETVPGHFPDEMASLPWLGP